MNLALNPTDPEWDTEYQDAAESIHAWLREHTLLALSEVNLEDGEYSKGKSKGKDNAYALTQEQIEHARSTAQRKAQGRQLQYAGKISGEEILRLQSEGMTRQQIADLAGCSLSRIGTLRRRHVVKTKGQDESQTV